MKFLIALSILASSTVFAQRNNRDEIRCYESSRQNGRGDLAYIMEEDRDMVKDLGGDHLKLVYPDHMNLKYEDGCLRSHRDQPSVSLEKDEISFCRGEGQRVRGLVPIEVYEEGGRDRGHDSETVYCERDILSYFEHHGGDDK